MRATKQKNQNQAIRTFSYLGDVITHSGDQDNLKTHWNSECCLPETKQGIIKEKYSLKKERYFIYISASQTIRCGVPAVLFFNVREFANQIFPIKSGIFV